MDVTNKKEFNLNDLFTFFSFLDVIDGLNKYFAEDETRVRVPRSFVEIKGPSKVIFYRFDAEMYLDKLIAWLRTEHGIFYYPGMEAKYAKTERIPPFTERMKNDGALRTLKKLHKIVTNVEVSDKADSPTLIAAAIENDFAVLKQDLKNALEAKESFFETKGKLNYRKEIMDYIVNSEKKYGVRFSDLHDDEEFRPELIFDDLLDKMTRDEHILKDLYRDILHKQPDGLSDEDIATKILDKMLEMKERLDHKEAEIVGEIRVKQYEKELLDYIYKEYEGRIKKDKNNIRYSPSSVRSSIKKIISDYARSRTRVDILETRIKSIFDRYKTKFTVDEYMSADPTISFMLDCIWSWIGSSAESRDKTRAEIENYKLSLKDYILKDIKEHGYRYDGLEVKSIEEIVDWIIMLAACDRSGIALRDIYTTVASPVERRRYNIDNCDGEIVDHMKDYILRRFEGLHANTEYCLKKMSELDGCRKDLKILEDQQEFLIKQNSELATKVSTKDDEISRLKGLINAMNEEVGDM